MQNGRKVGEVEMRIHEMTISMVADNGLMPVTVTYNSPKWIIRGARVRFGWFFIRIGARILYGNTNWSKSTVWKRMGRSVK